MSELPTTMKAAILETIGQPLIIDEVELPNELDYGQVLVKLAYSGICGSQLGEIDGVKGEDRFLPHLLGHEGSGEVVCTGPGVSHVQKGDSVVLHWRPGKGIAAKPPKYRWNGRQLNAGFVTTFNEYAVISENRMTPIPAEFPKHIAPLFGCAVTTGLGVIVNNAGVKIGDSIVVLGAGGVGLNVIQGAAMASAYPIIAVDLFDNRLQLAGEMGATHLLNAGHCDIEIEIRKILNGSPADIVVDNTGKTDIINLAYQMTAPQGKTILVGVPRVNDTISIFSLPLHFGKTLTGSHGGESQPGTDIPKYIKLYNNDRLELDSLITDEFNLEGINQAIAGMRNGDITGRCLIKF